MEKVNPIVITHIDQLKPYLINGVYCLPDNLVLTVGDFCKLDKVKLITENGFYSFRSENTRTEYTPND